MKLRPLQAILVANEVKTFQAILVAIDKIDNII